MDVAGGARLWLALQVLFTGYFEIHALIPRRLPCDNSIVCISAGFARQHPARVTGVEWRAAGGALLAGLRLTAQRCVALYLARRRASAGAASRLHGPPGDRDAIGRE